MCTSMWGPHGAPPGLGLGGLKDLLGSFIYAPKKERQKKKKKNPTPTVNLSSPSESYKSNNVQSIRMDVQLIQWSSPFKMSAKFE